jgi:hypothetical protein
MALDLSSWSHYWGDCKGSYALQRTTDGEDWNPPHCVIVDLYHSSIALIEDNDIFFALVNKLREEGVRVIRPGEGINLAVPSPFAQVREEVGGKYTITEANRRLRELAQQGETGRREWIRANNL